jgi:hypothetical protein
MRLLRTMPKDIANTIARDAQGARIEHLRALQEQEKQRSADAKILHDLTKDSNESLAILAKRVDALPLEQRGVASRELEHVMALVAGARTPAQGDIAMAAMRALQGTTGRQLEATRQANVHAFRPYTPYTSPPAGVVPPKPGTLGLAASDLTEVKAPDNIQYLTHAGDGAPVGPAAAAAAGQPVIRRDRDGRRFVNVPHKTDLSGMRRRYFRQYAPSAPFGIGVGGMGRRLNDRESRDTRPSMGGFGFISGRAMRNRRLDAEEAAGGLGPQGRNMLRQNALVAAQAGAAALGSGNLKGAAQAAKSASEMQAALGKDQTADAQVVKALQDLVDTVKKGADEKDQKVTAFAEGTTQAITELAAKIGELAAKLETMTAAQSEAVATTL